MKITKKQNAKVPDLTLPFLLGILSFILRFALISRGPFSVDTLNLALKAEQTLETGQLQFLFGTGYPLTMLLGAGFLALLQLFSKTDPIFAVNLMSVTLSSLSIPLLYLVVAKLIDKRAAFFSAVLWSFFPFFLSLSVYGMSHTPSIFFLLLGINTTLNFRKLRQSHWLALGALCFGCMGASRLQDLLFMVPAISFLFFDVTSGNAAGGSLYFRARAFFAFWILAFFTAALFHFPLVLNNSNNGYLAQLNSYLQVSSGRNFLGFFSPAFFESLRWVVFGLTPAGLLVSLLGCVRLWKDHKGIFVLLIWWFLFPLFLAGNLSMTTPRFIVAFLIPPVIAAGKGFSSLLQIPQRTFQTLITAVFIIIIAILFRAIYPILSFRHHYALLPDFGRYIRENTEPDALVICGDEAPFVLHYGKRNWFRKPQSAYAISNAELKDFKVRMENAFEKGTPIYITSSGIYSYDANQSFSNYLKTNFKLEEIGDHWTEGWHQGATRLRIGKETLYRIRSKTPE